MQFEWAAWEEAANDLLDNKLSTEEAAKYADHSVELEDRFETELTKSRALTALGGNQEAFVARDRAISMATQQQVHDAGRGLQFKGRQDEALDLFRANIKKHPNTWVAHNEAARIAVAKGDFDTAIKEMKLAASLSPEALKVQHLEIVRRLEDKQDINR